MDEPGEHHVTLALADDGDVDVRVRWYSDWVDKIPTSKPSEERLAGRVRLARFRGEVLSALQRLLREHGLEGYRKKWVKHDFPVAEYEALGGKPYH